MSDQLVKKHDQTDLVTHNLGYDTENNKFNDNKLSEQFQWSKKAQHLGSSAAEIEVISNLDMIQQVKHRREAYEKSEREKILQHDEQRRIQASADNAEWESIEKVNQLVSVELRLRLRFKERRETPLDNVIKAALIAYFDYNTGDDHVLSLSTVFEHFKNSPDKEERLLIIRQLGALSLLKLESQTSDTQLLANRERERDRDRMDLASSIINQLNHQGPSVSPPFQSSMDFVDFLGALYKVLQELSYPKYEDECLQAVNSFLESKSTQALITLHSRVLNKVTSDSDGNLQFWRTVLKRLPFFLNLNLITSVVAKANERNHKQTNVIDDKNVQPDNELFYKLARPSIPSITSESYKAALLQCSEVTLGDTDSRVFATSTFNEHIKSLTTGNLKNRSGAMSPKLLPQALNIEVPLQRYDDLVHPLLKEVRQKFFASFEAFNVLPKSAMPFDVLPTTVNAHFVQRMLKRAELQIAMKRKIADAEYRACLSTLIDDMHTREQRFYESNKSDEQEDEDEEGNGVERKELRDEVLNQDLSAQHKVLLNAVLNARECSTSTMSDNGEFPRIVVRPGLEIKSFDDLRDLSSRDLMAIEARLIPRKPKYFNSIKFGYEWTYYNKAHFDRDKPPPKAVLGYRFTIFYPDLLNPNVVPQYTIHPSDTPNTVILRFSAGPPYQDIAFKIIDTDWDRSRGYKCYFLNGVMTLNFQLKRRTYKK